MKKFVSLIIILSLLSPTAVSASVVLGDIPRILKDYVADPAVNIAARKAISSITKSMTTWAASGFEGKPSFVQDLKKAAKQAESEVTEKLLNEITISNNGQDTNLGFLCSPFAEEIHNAFRVQLAVQKDSTFIKANGCTIDSILEEAGNTIEDFKKDFSKGGWPAWLELTSGTNNRYGAYFTIQQELWKRQAEEEDKRTKELTFGQGFLSSKQKGDCLTYESDIQNPIGPQREGADLSLVGPAEEDGCVQRGPDKIITPGTVIANQLNKTIGLGADKLVSADELSELVGAILAGLAGKILSSQGGLAGTGDPDSPVSQLDKETADDEASTNLSISSARQNARNSASQAQAVSSLQQQLDTCRQELATLQSRFTLRVTVEAQREADINNNISLSSDSNEVAVAKKEADCNRIANEITSTISGSIEATLQSGLNISGGGGGGGWECYFNLGTGPASREVTWSGSDVVGNSGAGDFGVKQGLGLEPLKYYEKMVLDLDIDVGNTSGGQNFGFGNLNDLVGFIRSKVVGQYAGYWTMIMREGNKMMYDAHGAGNFGGSIGVDWAPNVTHHLTITQDAKAGTVSFRVTRGGSVVGEGTFGHPSADIIDVGDGLQLYFVEHDGWAYRNIRATFTPGGPYQGGVRGNCTGSSSDVKDPKAPAPTSSTTPTPNSSPFPIVPTTALGNNASCTSIIAPRIVAVGSTFVATTTMTNTGSRSWTVDTTPHALGPQNPQDNFRWKKFRVAMPVAQVVSGQKIDFVTTYTAPTLAGVYPFDWRMLEEQVEWFGSTCTASITVQ